jgi:phage N-6-adenine-methyltransferase
MNTELMFSSKDQTWTTPKDFFDKCNEEFDFVLDAAALRASALCEQWYGPDHSDEYRRNAFDRDWCLDAAGGSIWLNPPYGRAISAWMRKANVEAMRGATIVCLVPSRTDTKWFHNFCIHHEVRFLRGRLKFGGNANSAPFPSALVVMRPETAIIHYGE